MTQNIDKDIQEEINKLIKIDDNTKNKKILIFSGGGMKGLSLFGVLKALDELKILEKIEIFAGASVGAMILCLYLIGYSTKELEEFNELFNFQNLTTIVDYGLDNINDIINKYGIDDGKNIFNILEKILEARNIKKDITLLELYKLNHKKFIVTATCLDTYQVEYISYETYPNMKLTEAIRITASFPLYYQPYKYNNKTFIDGGCIDNYPIILFKDRLEEVIGFYLQPVFKNNKLSNIKEYIVSVFEVLQKSFIDNILRGWDTSTVNLYIDQNVLNFDIKLEAKKELFKIGYTETLKYFN
jgi:NTE family protein